MQGPFYEKEDLSALEAQRLANFIAFAPFIFQVARLLIKFGVLDALFKAKNKGLTLDEIAHKADLSHYASQCLLESAISAGICTLRDGSFQITKTGVFLLTDTMTQVNLNFTHDVCYKGLYHLEEALKEGKPSGLKEFGDWPTVYEGLSSLPPPVQKSWFAFDHFYSDAVFPTALNIIFKKPIHTLLDVGGNTGRWASKCVQYSSTVEVTIMDLPQQIGLMRKSTQELPESNRIHGHAANLLDESIPFPTGFDVIWMSQFLDCFSEESVTSILRRAAASMSQDSRLFILETLWDRQKYETSAMCLNQISLYFTAIANGNSKMFYSQDLLRCIALAGLQVEVIHDNLGLGHSLFECRIPR